MSNLNSQFDILAGEPPSGRSAMEGSFPPKSPPTITLSEGVIVAVEDDGTGNPVVDAATSSAADAVPDYLWLVTRGSDSWDSSFADKISCLALHTGLVFKVDTSGSFAVGDLVYANAGVITKLTAGADKQAIGQVIESNATAGYIVVAT